jgi:large subunit ribosomal protein L13
LKPAWHVIDAQGKTLGRLSSEIALLLQGKHKPTYVSYLNSGDFVVVVNAEKFKVTGKKLEQKIYYSHSGYHGGLKEVKLSVLLKKKPTRALRHAIKGMLPKSTLGRRMLSRLKLYAGETHPHAAQVNAGRKASAEKAAPEAEIGAGTPQDDAKPASKAKGEVAANTSAEADTKPASKARGEAAAKSPSKAGAKLGGKAKSAAKSGSKATGKAAVRTPAKEEA